MMMRDAAAPIVGGVLVGLLAGSLALHAVGAFALLAVPPTAASNCDVGPPGNPYDQLEAHRPDVLRFYTSNGWNPLLQCRQIFDDWLAHSPDGGPPTSAAQFVAKQRWPTTSAANPTSGH